MNPDNEETIKTLAPHRLMTATAVIGAIALLTMLLRHNGFWIDELYTLHSIRLGWKEMVLERLNRGHFPGYFALVRLWYSLWPEQLFEVGLRSMSVLFYLLAVASFWPLAKRVNNGPAALVALALFACNGIALRQASEARMYTVVLLIAVWITRAWFELQQPTPRKMWSIILMILAVLGFSVSATVGVLLVSMLVISFFSFRENRRTTYTLILSLALGLMVFIPGALLHVKTAERLGVSASKPLVFLSHPVALMPGVQIWDDYYKTDWRLTALLVVGIVITVTAIYLLVKNRRDLTPVMRRMGLIVAFPLVLITLLYPAIEIFKLDLMGPPRYFLTLMPMAVLLGGWALMRLPKTGGQRLALHGALTVFLLLNAYTILTVRVERFRKQLLEHLAPQYRQGDGLVVTANEIEDGVELYVPGAKVDEAISRWEFGHEALRKRLAGLSGREVVWIVWYRGNDSPLITVAEQMWGPGESNKADDPYGKLRIFKFTPGVRTN